MKSTGLYKALFFRIMLFILLLALVAFLLLNHYKYNAIVAGILGVLCAVEIYFFLQNKLLFYDKTIQSILQHDFSTSFPETYQHTEYKNLYLLYNRSKAQQFEQVSKEQIYQSILNNLDTAILILKKQQDQWEIFLMNDYFSRYFEAPKVQQWQHLKNYLPALCEAIENTGFTDTKTSVNVKIEDKDSQTFMMQTSMTKSYEQDYFVVVLDSIQRVIEKKEKEAWINLMKIISHELMNSLTPIRSLSQSLQDIVSQDEIKPDDLEDLRYSLATIVNRSDHLQFFVDNYRKLTMLPTPEKTEVEVVSLIEDCLRIMSPLLKQEQIEIHNEISQFKIIEADKNQLEQVIINLITNSIHALKDKASKAIHLTSHTENNRLFLSIADTGKGIEKEIEDKIFLPFFTTRKDGAGIGLTLSKNIIEAHGGYLSYEAENGRTRFVICLIGN